MEREKYPLENQNSCGQGQSPLALAHHLSKAVRSFGYLYSHSNNVGTIPGDGWQLYHTFRKGGHTVLLIEDRDIWQTSYSCAYDHSWAGKGLPELKQHLASKARRYSGLKLSTAIKLEE